MGGPLRSLRRSAFLLAALCLNLAAAGAGTETDPTRAIPHAESLSEVLDLLKQQVQADQKEEFLPLLKKEHFIARGMESLQTADNVFTGERKDAFEAEARPKLVAIFERGEWVENARVELQYDQFRGPERIPAFSATLIIPTEEQNPSGPVAQHPIFPLYINLQPRD